MGGPLNICLQLLLYVAVATPQERQEFKEYWRYQRKLWVTKHIIADDPYEQWARVQRELEDEERKHEDATE